MNHRHVALTALVTVPLVWSLSGCGGGDKGKGGGGTGGTKPSPPVVSEGAATKPAASDKKADSEAAAPAGEEGWGTIKGQIVYDGTPPTPTVLVKKGDSSIKDAATCAAEDVLSEELVVNAENNGLRWVLVYLAGRPKIHPDLKEADGTVEIGQKNCHFIPHVQAMRQGQKFVITSDDPIAHNTKGDGFKNPGFNPVVPPAPEGGRSALDGPDLVAETLPMPIACNIHPWMKAWLGIYNHPYFAVTDENGNFTIEKVPAGELKLNIWHEKGGFGEGGKEGKPITVKAGDTSDLGQIKYKTK